MNMRRGLDDDAIAGTERTPWDMSYGELDNARNTESREFAVCGNGLWRPPAAIVHARCRCN